MEVYYTVYIYYTIWKFRILYIYNTICIQCGNMHTILNENIGYPMVGNIEFCILYYVSAL